MKLSVLNIRIIDKASNPDFLSGKEKKISRNNFKLTIQKLKTNVINTLYFGGLTLNQTFIPFIYILNGKKIKVKGMYFL